jgi:solute carrier family 38 (sodium-coupled neutral amino acid transporter), member 2
MVLILSGIFLQLSLFLLLPTSATITVCTTIAHILSDSSNIQILNSSFHDSTVHSIDNELEDRTQIKPIVRTSLVLCSSVYIATSFFAYLLFGEGTLDDVLANFDANLGIPFSSVFDDIVRVSYAAHVMLVFPIVFFALRLNLDGLLFPTSRHISRDNKRFAIITISLLTVIYLAAILIPSIWDAFQFTGATAAVLIGFIFPAMVILR